MAFERQSTTPMFLNRTSITPQETRQFEQELQKGRLSLLSAAVFAMTVFALPGGMWASYEVAAKLTTNILQAIASEGRGEHARHIPGPH